MTPLPMLLGIPGLADISLYAIFQGTRVETYPFARETVRETVFNALTWAWQTSVGKHGQRPCFPTRFLIFLTVLDSPCLTCQPAHSAAQSEICRILLFLFLPVLIKLRDDLLDGWLADFDVQDSLRPGQPLRHPPDGQLGPDLPQIQTRRSFH